MLATGLAAAQMMGQEKAQQPPAATQPNIASMQSMMAQMRGMMAEMQGMMAGQGMPGMMSGRAGMMSGKGMPAMMGAHRGMSAGQENSGTNAAQPSNGNWTDMMRSMQSLGDNMQEMISQMDNAMINKSLVSNRAAQSNLGAMQGEMRSMMGSLKGMIRHMEQFQKSRPATL